MKSNFITREKGQPSLRVTYLPSLCFDLGQSLNTSSAAAPRGADSGLLNSTNSRVISHESGWTSCCRHDPPKREEMVYKSI